MSYPTLPPLPPPPPTERLRPHRYRLYIDESGDHAYELLNDPCRRYLALLGVWFRQSDDYVAFADELESLKRSVFGPRPDKPVILHRTDIINRKGPFGILCDAEIRRRFDEGLLGVIGRAKFTLCCVIIDKQVHHLRYADPFPPYDYCLAAMLDRYSGWLNYWNAVGDAMAESRGREEDMQLKVAYRRVYEGGTIQYPREHHQRALTSKDLKVEPKTANIAGLQLADLLAHPVKQARLATAGLVPAGPREFGQRLYQTILAKFNVRRDTGMLEGYGVVWLSR